MSTEDKALCANLTAALNDWQCKTGDDRYASLITRALAALARPEPVAPTDEDLIQLAIDTRLYRFQATTGDPVQYEMTEQQVHAFARAVLARWGNYPVKPDSSPANTINQEDYDHG